MSDGFVSRPMGLTPLVDRFALCTARRTSGPGRCPGGRLALGRRPIARVSLGGLLNPIEPPQKIRSRSAGAARLIPDAHVDWTCCRVPIDVHQVRIEDRRSTRAAAASRCSAQGPCRGCPPTVRSASDAQFRDDGVIPHQFEMIDGEVGRSVARYCSVPDCGILTVSPGLESPTFKYSKAPLVATPRPALSSARNARESMHRLTGRTHDSSRPAREGWRSSPWHQCLLRQESAGRNRAAGTKWHCRLVIGKPDRLVVVDLAERRINGQLVRDRFVLRRDPHPRRTDERSRRAHADDGPYLRRRRCADTGWPRL